MPVNCCPCSFPAVGAATEGNHCRLLHSSLTPVNTADYLTHSLFTCVIIPALECSQLALASQCVVFLGGGGLARFQEHVERKLQKPQRVTFLATAHVWGGGREKRGRAGPLLEDLEL